MFRPEFQLIRSSICWAAGAQGADLAALRGSERRNTRRRADQRNTSLAPLRVAVVGPHPVGSRSGVVYHPLTGLANPPPIFIPQASTLLCGVLVATARYMLTDACSAPGGRPGTSEAGLADGSHWESSAGPWQVWLLSSACRSSRYRLLGILEMVLRMKRRTKTNQDRCA